MLAQDQTIPDFTLPTFDLRSVARRLALPALFAAAAVAAVFLVGGQVHTITAAMKRIVGLDGGWAAAGIVFECISLDRLRRVAVAGGGPRDAARQRPRERADHVAGAAATRLLPTAGAGGAALALWTLRRAGLRSSVAARTLLVVPGVALRGVPDLDRVRPAPR